MGQKTDLHALLKILLDTFYEEEALNGKQPRSLSKPTTRKPGCNVLAVCCAFACLTNIFENKCVNKRFWWPDPTPNFRRRHLGHHPPPLHASVPDRVLMTHIFGVFIPFLHMNHSIFEISLAVHRTEQRQQRTPLRLRPANDCGSRERRSQPHLC